MEDKKVKELLEKYKHGVLNAEERAILESWYNHEATHGKHELSDARLLDNVNLIGAALPLKYPAKTIKLWPGIAAVAAAVILIVGTISFYNSVTNPNVKQDQALAAVNDLPAGGSKAYLTLGSGERIALSNQKKAILINAANLTYNDGTEIDANAGENLTLSTPLGGTYQLILPDQSKIWLNAGSIIKFPSSFAKAKVRSVILTGEAYFEIARDKYHPFIVKSNGQEIKVLGTHFNVNSYSDREITKTTLLEGSVRINENTLIKPGEQATGSGSNIKVAQADTEEAIAWKNGYFKFNENLESIMNKVGRWYNAEIIYQFKPDPALTFSGKISRSKNLSDVLKMIEFNGDVHFKVEGRRITIMK
ncbi:DUF4974 domain-containing protein [Pedobacter sp. MC2016-14]|uniref:FecR family protein n=1 Tax=Pedobacter sp. MC2016-14 TaxID=2897327 RepID=UPI001E41F842|nr:FecR family protein [Pedobacter sp. MC2016-14]MCD0489185.1 DUF4974 domain-containing protein [Pedobacter sp. MC2016-14]